MKWKTVVMTALGATVGTVCAHTFLNEFNLEFMVSVGIASFLGAMFLGFITTLGRRQ